MKLRKLFLILAVGLCLVSQTVVADEDNEAKERAEKANKSGEISDKDGIQLSELMRKRIGVAIVTPKHNDATYEVPIKSLVYHQNEISIYRLRKDFFKLIDIEIISQTPTLAKVSSKELEAGDKIVSQGAPLIRAADLASKNGIEGEGL